MLQVVITTSSLIFCHHADVLACDLGRYEMKATGKAQMAGSEKVLDLYAANLQLEEQLHQVQREVEDAKSIAGKVSDRPATFIMNVQTIS